MPIETPRTYINLAFEPDPPPRRMPYRRVVAGVGALAALALGGGFLLAPMMDRGEPVRTAAAPEAQAPAPSAGLDIIVDDRPDPEADGAPSPSESATILPPLKSAPAEPPQREDPRPTLQAAAAPQAPTERPKTAPTPAPPPAARPMAPAPRIAEAPEVRPYTPTPPPTAQRAGRARPSFNCRYARTVSERMVCADPYLAAADRRLARAYGQAIRRGIPEPELRRQQDIWLGVRESAARYGPEGVAHAYEARIGELQSLAR